MPGIAVGLWLALATMGLMRPVASGWHLLVGLAIAGVGLLIAWRPGWVRRGQSGRSRGPSVVAVAGLVLAGAGLGMAVGAAHLARTAPQVLRGPITAGAAATLEAVVTSDPRALPTRYGQGRWAATATAHRVAVRGRYLAVRIPILLLGGQLEGLRYGSTVRVAGRLGPSEPGRGSGFLLRAAEMPVELVPPGVIASTTSRVRTGLRSAAAALPADPAALVLGLAVGDESLVSPSLDEAMVRSGLAHLTAVSGANTTLVCGLVLWLAAAVGLGWRARVLAAGVVLAGYVALVHPQPSVIRAAAMAVVALAALARGGRRDGLVALSGAVVVLLAFMPDLALSVGFALSVGATAGLLLLAARIAHGLAGSRLGGWLPPPMLMAVAVTAAATLATLPLTVGLGNGLSMAAVPANLMAAPAVPVVTVLGLAAALLAVPVPAVASLLAWAASPFAGWIAWIARTGSDFPGAVVPIPAGWQAALTCAGLPAAWWLWRGHVQRSGGVGGAPRYLGRAASWLRALAVACALGVLAMGWRAHRVAGNWPPPDWLFVSCDVGQGDASVVRLPGPGPPMGILVDAGGDPAALRRCLGRLRLHSLAAVVITHSHADHVEGLSAVAQMWPAQWPGMPLFASATSSGVPQRLLAGRDVGAHALREGGQLAASGAGLRIEVLWPAREVAESPENNASLVLLATLATGEGELRVLLAGDVESAAQTAIMARHRIAVDVIKVAHHGSAQADPGFLAWSGSRLALISAGAGNEYGHPAPATLTELGRLGALVGRTDLQGGLAVVLRAGRPALVAQR